MVCGGGGAKKAPLQNVPPLQPGPSSSYFLPGNLESSTTIIIIHFRNGVKASIKSRVIIQFSVLESTNQSSYFQVKSIEARQYNIKINLATSCSPISLQYEWSVLLLKFFLSYTYQTAMIGSKFWKAEENIEENFYVVNLRNTIV